jgi:hypothetical protein
MISAGIAEIDVSESVLCWPAFSDVLWPIIC